MAKDDSGLRRLGFIVGALLLWVSSYTGAVVALNQGPSSAAVRGTLAAIGVLGFLPWLVATAVAIRAQDEFARLVHLVALGGAFAATAMFVLASDLLQRAELVGYVPLSRILLVMAVSWAVALVLASRSYR